MKIYLVSTNETIDYDMHDAMVVIANSGEEAIKMAQEKDGCFKKLSFEDVGIAHNDQEKGVLLASFNAG